MRPWAVFIALALAGCAGGAGASSGSSGSSGAELDAGQAFLGGSLAFADARAGQIQPPDAGAEVLAVQIVPGPEACPGAPPTSTSLYLALAGGGGAAPAPGHYDVAQRQVLAATVFLFDPSGAARGPEDATAGSVDLDALGPPARGRFDFSFPSGTLQGSFTAAPCP